MTEPRLEELLKGHELEKWLVENNYSLSGFATANELGIQINTVYGEDCRKKGLLLIDNSRFDKDAAPCASYRVYVKQTT